MKKLLVFGEVLFDVFENSAEIGGAPFNVAAHFSALGAKVDFVSAVGNDPLGKDALQIIREKHIGDAYVATVNAPTGNCKVTLTGGHPSYDLAAHVAYDQIPLPKNISSDDYGAIYFGTLALREDVSRNTLLKLLPLVKERFYDINVRAPYCPAKRIREFMNYATTVKISREEADTLSPFESPLQYAKQLVLDYPQLKRIIITLDKDGSAIYDVKRQAIHYSSLPKEKPISTVGAGDAFCACYLYHAFQKSSIPHTLNNAAKLADFVITQLGAVPKLPIELKNEITKEEKYG
ncbi:MAG: hypothetical protein E7616_06435 [Ruminococcaceae bacterium]|nr:hypothetical protein [Oscillospiraceae bacterium]